LDPLHRLGTACPKIVDVACVDAPPGVNTLQQQARFDTFVHEYNQERPHQALESVRSSPAHALAFARPTTISGR